MKSYLLSKSTLINLFFIFIIYLYQKNLNNIVYLTFSIKSHGQYGCGNILRNVVNTTNKSISRNGFYKNIVFEGNEIHSIGNPIKRAIDKIYYDVNDEIFKDINDSLKSFLNRNKGKSISVDSFKVGYNQKPQKGPFKFWPLNFRTYVYDSVSILYIWPEGKVDTFYGKQYFPIVHHHDESNLPVNHKFRGTFGCGNLSMANITVDGSLSNSSILNIEKCYIHQPESVHDITINSYKSNFKNTSIKKLSDSLQIYYKSHIYYLPNVLFSDSLFVGFNDKIVEINKNYFANDSLFFFYGQKKIGVLAK